MLTVDPGYQPHGRHACQSNNLDFVLHGQGDIAIEADDPGDAERKFSAIPVEDLLMARRMEVREISPSTFVPVYRQLAEDYVELSTGRWTKPAPPRPKRSRGAERGVLRDQDGKLLEPVVSTDHEIEKDAMSDDPDPKK